MIKDYTRVLLYYMMDNHFTRICLILLLIWKEHSLAWLSSAMIWKIFFNALFCLPNSRSPNMAADEIF